VFVNVWAINRDPKYWDDRRRMFPGMALAQASMELVLAALLYHFDWELPSGLEPSQLDMTDQEMGVTARRKHDLYLHPVVRVPRQA
jgi:cytochrome P450